MKTADMAALNEPVILVADDLAPSETVQMDKSKIIAFVTKDGRKLHLYANIGNVSDTMSALQNDAEGIGLFRSEFLYLESKDYPTEEEQFQAYKTVAQTMAGKKVIIRTLNIGADKQVDYF